MRDKERRLGSSKSRESKSVSNRNLYVVLPSLSLFLLTSRALGSAALNDHQEEYCHGFEADDLRPACQLK